MRSKGYPDEVQYMHRYQRKQNPVLGLTNEHLYRTPATTYEVQFLLSNLPTVEKIIYTVREKRVWYYKMVVPKPKPAASRQHDFQSNLKFRQWNEKAPEF